MTVEARTILLYELLSKREEPGLLSGQDHPEIVREQIIKVLGEVPTVTVDLSRLRSLSPSFAYEAFGKLVDSFGENVAGRLQFSNDPLGLQSRILDAVQRRRQILHPKASTG